jgi:hypothetical protein
MTFAELQADSRLMSHDMYAWTAAFEGVGIHGGTAWGVTTGSWYGWRSHVFNRPIWLPIGHYQLSVFA